MAGMLAYHMSVLPDFSSSPEKA